ncbi:hypothetical protein vB_RpoS-V16_02 [Ruegeria phage vB_RpoS-V16]|uniref:hypothetical protein n=1 Tax=Ruegeria phage vB_RpoS-V16 TaxID=2218618 RepID=UPI000DCAA8FE|nr:hypothetical protein JT311_gp02 [Ruegeria phage vB_RpoS-V16]AWY09438.1 hypothetical protein vB_RpoS-V16_02 [Ruegeria phage vB_RpoS-V16]
MKIETVEFELPGFWLSPLFNGDDSGLDDSDIAAIRAFESEMVREYGCCHAIDYRDDSGFKWRHDASRFGVLACNCETVVFDVTKRESGK